MFSFILVAYLGVGSVITVINSFMYLFSGPLSKIYIENIFYVRNKQVWCLERWKVWRGR